MPTPLTPTETKLLELLSDGQPHYHKELVKCLWDEMGGRNNVRQRIFHLRKKLPAGQAILCVYHRKQFAYRLVSIISQPTSRNATSLPPT